jgi:hypothetical protein
VKGEPSGVTISTKGKTERDEEIEFYKGRIFWPANEGFPGEKVGFRDRT